MYSNENLVRCLNDLNGLAYHKSTDEQKRQFFEIKKKDAKKAGVLIPLLYHQNEPSMLFTLRSPQLAAHKVIY